MRRQCRLRCLRRPFSHLRTIPGRAGDASARPRPGEFQIRACAGPLSRRSIRTSQHSRAREKRRQRAKATPYSASALPAIHPPRCLSNWRKANLRSGMVICPWLVVLGQLSAAETPNNQHSNSNTHGCGKEALGRWMFSVEGWAFISLCSQCHHWINFGCAPGGNQAGQQCHGHQQQRDGYERCGIQGADLEQ